LDSQHGQAKDDQRDPSAGTSVLEERHRANQQGGLEPESQGGSIPEPETDLGGIIEQREIGAMDDQIEDPMGEDGGGDEYTRAAVRGPAEKAIRGRSGNGPEECGHQAVRVGHVVKVEGQTTSRSWTARKRTQGGIVSSLLFATKLMP